MDDDVARLIEQESRRRGTSFFKEVVNNLLRLGLAASKRPTRMPLVVSPRNLGLAPGLSFDNVEQLLESIAGSLHR